MSDARDLRVALVGCGRISDKHFRAIDRVEGLALVGVADIVSDRAASAGREWRVPHFGSLEAMLDGVECDVVTVATPSGLHPEHGAVAARAGKHVVCEKPMAITLTAADELLDACDGAGVHLFVVKQNRLNPTVRLVKSAVEKGRFGRIHLANTTVRWTRPQEYYDMDGWRGTLEMDGGALMNQGSHYVDLLLWLCGPAESVVAQTGTLGRDIESEDTATALVRFQSGAFGVIEVTTLTYPRNLEGSLTILGETGTVKIGGTAVNRIDHWHFEDTDEDDRRVVIANTEPPTVYGFGHEPYYRNVLAVLRGEAEPGTDGHEGRKSLELIRGIYESAETGRRVVLPAAD